MSHITPCGLASHICETLGGVFYSYELLQVAVIEAGEVIHWVIKMQRYNIALGHIKGLGPTI